MSTPITVDGVEAVKSLGGRDLGTTDWVEITQEMVDQVADAAGDHWWIHVDGERANRESPFCGPVARRSSVPKTALLAPARDGGQVCTRSFIPVQPHTSIGVLAAVSVLTGMLPPGAVGHELTAPWPQDRSLVDVEHPTGHLLVDVVVDADAGPPRVIRSGVARTARMLFDGTAFPRA